MSPTRLLYLKNRRILKAVGSFFCLMIVCGMLAIVGGLLQLTPLIPAFGFVVRGTRCYSDMFDRAQAFTTTPGQNGWTIKDTSSAGTPTYLCVSEDGGSAKLTLASTNEEEIVTLYHNDVTQFDLAMVQKIRFVLKASLDSVTDLVFGLASAQNDTEDSVATNLWFKIDGSDSATAVVCESDDGTNDLDDKATGVAISTTYKLFEIDLTNGLSDIRFYIDGDRVAASQAFSMASLASGTNVQPFVQLHKASGTGVGYVQIAMVEIDYKYAYGA